MVERLDYGGEHYDYDEDELDIQPDHQEDHQEEEQEEHREEYGLEFYQDPDEDFGGVDDDTIAEGFQERHDQVEHRLDHAADDTTKADFEAQFAWRSKARRSRKGRFVPPDMRTYRWPVFVPVSDLQNQDGG